jgi:preprotein translocase subunit Sec63
MFTFPDKHPNVTKEVKSEIEEKLKKINIAYEQLCE